MKKLLMASQGDLFAERITKSTLVLLTTLGLGAIFWMASASVAQAADLTPRQMIEEQLPQGQTVETAPKADFLIAVCRAVQKHRPFAPKIVRFAIESHKEWKKDILRTAFRCIGFDDCRLLNFVLREVILLEPDEAREYTELAIEWAPGCAGAFGRAGRGERGDFGNFDNTVGNQNPPPGSIGGGGGGQGNLVQICHNGTTLIVSPEGAQNHLQNHPGDTFGPCVVTPVTNQ